MAKPHRNITLRRILLDICQYFRTQTPATRLFGRPFQRSRKYIEIDITYQCNLQCFNCNRSCTQAPSAAMLSKDHIRQFIDDTLTKNYQWERIRILGGEPTLHPDFLQIVALLRDYRKVYNPSLRLVVCTNGHGRKVNRMLSALPADVIRKNTAKSASANLFRPFNRAPRDSAAFRFADYESGCRIIADCGMGLTPQGYYVCAVAGAVDRVLGLRKGRITLPAKADAMADHCRLFCPYCGHFGFQWPTRKIKQSPTWQQAYSRYSHRRNLARGGIPQAFDKQD